MSWASRRRTEYLVGVIAFFVIVVGLPIAWHFLSTPPTCFDGIQNQGETAVDEGGPCQKLNPNDLQPWAVMWTRAFKVRDGSYSAVAYIENPNPNAGVASANYTFGLYDSNNIEIATESGQTPIMPGGITPVLLTGINTGNRVVVHAYFQLTDPVLDWERMDSPAAKIKIDNTQVSQSDTGPRIDAQARNTSVQDLRNVQLVAVVFDTAGNAFAASGTLVPDLQAGSMQPVAFTWPQPFPGAVGRVDITPIMQPVPALTGTQN